MKSVYIYLLSGLLALGHASPAQTDSLWTIEGVSNASVCLYQTRSKFSGFAGTGLIIAHKDRYYLLTASHIAKEMRSDAQIAFPKAGDNPLLLDLSSLVKDHKLIWKSHPSADLAITELNGFDKETVSRLKAYSFPSALIYPGKEISKDKDLIFLGFPVVDAQIDRIGSITTASPPIELSGINVPANMGVVLSYINFFPTAYGAHILSGTDEQNSGYFYLDIPNIKSAAGSAVSAR